jgi:peptide-methionine (S)-S-oxide reductase
MKLQLLAPVLAAMSTSPLVAQDESSQTATAVVGAGCFWCVEGVYENVPGVLAVESGFAGGTVPNPTYDQVTSGRTGHAEVVRITYDPSKISYPKLLELFWQIHDPTDPSGVWPDFGPMYRSIILPQGEEQLQQALAAKESAQALFPKPIATEIKPLAEFYSAEAYHQDFVRRNPDHPYVRRIALPKMEKAQKLRPTE